MMDLCLYAMNEAERQKVEYADIRIINSKEQKLVSENERVYEVKDNIDQGFGVRVLKNGAWGFASSPIIAKDEIAKVVRNAVAVAKASASVNSKIKDKKISVLKNPKVIDSFKTIVRVDPFSIPIKDKFDFMFEISRRMLKVDKIKKVYSVANFENVDKHFANIFGSQIHTNVTTTMFEYVAYAVDESTSKDRSYGIYPQTIGYEAILESDLLDRCERVASEAVMKLTAHRGVEGIKDLVLDPTHLALTIHESVGHATELDRALGMEESLSGRTFATVDKLNKMQYGSPIVNLVADLTLENGLATHGYDDDGTKGKRWHIVKDGIFSGYSTSIDTAPEISMSESNGRCNADSWFSIPIVRIPNLGLMPGKDNLSVDDLIAGVDDGIYIEGMGSFSIDQMRENFQFGGDVFWEIKHGKITRMLDNVTYQAITRDFWNSCDAIAGEKYWVKSGVANCGKGDPMQTAKMTHGAAPARFRNIKIGGGNV
ncbi:MAG: TldD/PmbA family protein [Oligoflexia bacterium]|nr:TldD/PmbA family protein [Oligoflexia bacterium]